MLRTCLLIPIVFLGFLLFAPGQAQQRKWPPSPHVAETDPLTPAEQIKKMKLPPGFEIQLVAAEPDIMNPMNIAFDARGRLWVTMSSEYPFPNTGKKTKDTVKILEDFGPDGKARKVTTFAENLNIPIGVLPLDDGSKAIVFSIPNVWLMEDTDGDGKADKKSVLLAEYGQRDTHGLTGEFQLGFDGWVYACHGFANTSTVKGRDGSTITMTSGNTYRFKPDGTKVNFHTHGQVNPFGLAFDPLGNLYSADCHTRPMYQLLRGAYYPSFGAPHDGIGFGPEMMTHSHGSTAIAGIVYYAATHFPPDFCDNLFIGNVVTNRINRDKLQQHGSTYLAIEQPDFVVSSDPWFRPVDIKLGPDGALYVADFYNRIIGHYEVPLTHPGRDFTHGRIWRIVYQGKGGTSLAPIVDRTRSPIADLIKDLADPNLTVRLTATDQLIKRGGKEGIAAVRKLLQLNANPMQRVHALWVLHRQDALTEDELAKTAADSEAMIRIHAMRVLADKQILSEEERKLAVAGLQDQNAFVQRCAAEALAAHPDPVNVRPLLDLRYRVPAADTHLLHAVRMAIRDQLKPAPTLAKIRTMDWSDKDLLELTGVALSIHNEQIADFLLNTLDLYLSDNHRLTEMTRHIARNGADGTGQRLAEFARKHFSNNHEAQGIMLLAIYDGTQQRGSAVPQPVQEWANDLCSSLLDANDNSQRVAGIDLAGKLRIAKVEGRISDLVKDDAAAVDQRCHAAHALAALAPRKSTKLLGNLLNSAIQPQPLRMAIADALAATNQPAARAELVQCLAAAPAELQLHLAKVLASSREGADELLKAIAAGKASPRLLQNREIENRLRSANPPELDNRLASLTKGLPPADAALQKIMRERRERFESAKTDLAAGAKLFEKNCAICHMLNNKGAKVAPQLDGIGARGPDRLLEDILDPSRNVDQAFRATMLELTNGQIVSGLLVREEGEVLVMVDAQGKEHRYSKADIAERLVSSQSPMPASFSEQIVEHDLYNLLAFLLAQRQPAPPAEAKQGVTNR